MAIRSVPQPPFSAELLADLHAGNVAPELGARLWSAAREDSDASCYLNALDAVSDRVRALGRDDRVLHPIPADVAARMERFLEELDLSEGPTERVATIRTLPLASEAASGHFETGDTVNLASPISPRPRRTMSLRWLAAAAAAVAVVGGGSVAAQLLRGDESAPTAGPTATAGSPDDDPIVTVALAALGRNDVSGPLGSRTALTDCVHAAGLERAVLGSTDMTYRGGAAVLILLSGPNPPKITALVVGPGCTTGDPQVKNVTDIG
ncbi:hypothetical protein [Nocardia sp. NPDC005366]|uniref:hypothetical protein n=1 Tax=Nocardia sp. NPDC005366 TaxID=3156878 RepID=UPI0033B5B10A